ncbi:MAG: ATP-binding protein, partial [Desulfobacterales bacterium]|nr:ATP-binding protein [Desulfobacterales bacterium]
MGKKFNTVGPCMPRKHYMIPSQNRCKGIMRLIDEEYYFVIHAARQSGKTTLLMELLTRLNDSRDYYTLYCTLETVQGVKESKEGIPDIVGVLASDLEMNPLLNHFPFASDVNLNNFNSVLKLSLAKFCAKLDKPLVILFDEVDCLSNGTLISFLRQLRAGYSNRAIYPFVHSIALVGMRNIRDYKAKIREDSQTLGSASPFNIA